MNPIYNKWPKTGALLLGLNITLFVLAVVWWPLRMMYADSAYMGWRLFQYGNLEFGHLRFSAAFTQFIPWLSVHANLGLGSILILYAAALQLPALVLSLYAFKKNLNGTALASLMLSTVWTARAWFNPVSEMYLAGVFALAWHAAYSRKAHPAISSLLFLLAAFSHSGMLPALFIMLFTAMKPNNLRYWWFNVLCFALVALIKWLDSDAYEQSFFDIFFQPEQWRHSYVPLYLKRTLRTGIGIPLLLLCVSSLVLLRRRLLDLGLFLAGGLALSVFLVIVFHAGDSDAVMEKNLMPLSLFLSLPLVEALNRESPGMMTPLATGLFILTGVFRLQDAHQWALNRHKQLRSLIGFTYAHCNSGKLAFTGSAEKFDNRLHVTWALPYETLMCSKLFSGQEQQVSVKIMRDESADSAYGKQQFCGAVFEQPLHVSKMRERGYKLSVLPYCRADASRCIW